MRRDMDTRKIEIGGMNCDHCVAAVRKGLARLPGVVVREVRVGAASVSFEPSRTSSAQIDAAIEEAGFKVVR
jgi:copper chaperone